MDEQEDIKPMTLGGAIKFLRSVKDWKQSQLADHLGIDRTYLSRLEGDTQLPSYKMLNRIAEALEINPAFLVMIAHGGDVEVAPFIPLILSNLWSSKNVRRFIMGMEV